MNVANPERGEVDLKIGDIEGIICAEMARLAALSGRIGTKSLDEIYQRLAGAEPVAMYAAIDCMLVGGDVGEMKKAINSPSDFHLVSSAVVESMSAFVSTGGKKD